MDVEEKLRRKAREFVSLSFEGLTDEEREQAEEQVLELIKNSIHEAVESKEFKDLEASGEEFNLEFRLSVVEGE